MDLRYLLSISQYNDVEDSRNFFTTQCVLTVIRTGSGKQQKWGMLKEALKAYTLLTRIAILENEHLNKLKQFCSGRFPALVQFYLYGALY